MSSKAMLIAMACQQYSYFTGKSNKKSSINACEEPFVFRSNGRLQNFLGPTAFIEGGIFVRGATRLVFYFIAATNE